MLSFTLKIGTYREAEIANILVRVKLGYPPNFNFLGKTILGEKTEATPEENKTDDLGKSEVSVEENLIIQPDENLVKGTANEMHAETNGLNSDAELQKT